MRKFIISDIHGLGNFYYPVMEYLDNINKNEDIELFINGDIIDRGLESADILLDVYYRIKENKFKITCLGGNHELMMLHEYNRYKETNKYDDFNDWYLRGGDYTDWGLHEKLNNKEYDKLIEYISNLKIYHKFEEKIGNKNIVLVHANPPRKVLDECNTRLKDDNEEVFFAVWTRNIPEYFPFRVIMGHEDYFSIVGHTPNRDRLGFSYDEEHNMLNIDGGCSMYAKGVFSLNHFPLVEVKKDYLKILTFSDMNEITDGNYFIDGVLYPFTEDELIEENRLINKKLKLKKYHRNDDGTIIH